MAPDRRLLAALAGAAVILQIIPDILGGYGYFIDELYYIACARRPALGYVDHPPLAPLVLHLHTAIFGESIVSIRLLPALAGGLTVYVAGWLAAFFGGGRFAQLLAGVSVMLSPMSLVLFDFFSMNGFEILFWTLALAVMLVMIRRDDPRLWIWFGVIAGVGLLNKHTMVLIGSAVVVGIALSPARRLLVSPWLLVGGLVAFALVLPNIWWQVANGWPSLEFYRNATLYKNLTSSPPKILLNQVLFTGPMLLPVWVAGLWLVLRDARYRAVGFAYLLLLMILIVSESSRPDRMAGLYPTLLAAGAAWWDGLLSHRKPVLKFAFVTVIIATGLLFAPLFQPILSPPTVARLVAAIGIDTQVERGEGKRAELPQWLADRFGWEELVAQVTTIYRELPDDEKSHAVVLAPSYGHAGALELLGDFPLVLSTHNTYHSWGRKDAGRLAGATVIAIGGSREDLESLYRDVQRVGTYTCDYCMTWRNDMPLYVARESKHAASEIEAAWEGFKHYE